MQGCARRFEHAGLAILASIGLAGCFGSKTPLVSEKESLKAFGESGSARRVEIGQMYGPAVEIVFIWSNASYLLADRSGRREPVAYRLAPLQEQWLLTQKSEGGVAAYGLARREGDRLWTYSPECRDLSEAERLSLQLALSPDGTCWLSSPAQLKESMKRLAKKPLKPDGYYELELKR